MVKLFKSAEKSAQTLLSLLIRDFDDVFNDIHTYKGKEIKILKRAQILVVDTW